MNGQRLINVLVSTLFLTACSAERTPSSPQTGVDGRKAGESITTVSLAPHQWRKDPDCFENGAQTLDEYTGYFDVSRVKWRSQYSFRGYLYTNFEGVTFVAAKRTERPDGLGEGHFQSQIYSQSPAFPSSVDPQTHWIEFIGREALCNSQRPTDAQFDPPFSPNLVRIEKIERQERVR